MNLAILNLCLMSSKIEYARALFFFTKIVILWLSVMSLHVAQHRFDLMSLTGEASYDLKIFRE